MIDTERIDRARAERGLSIAAVAKEAGMTYHGCWNILRGRTSSIRFDKLAALCRALHISPGEIFVDEHRESRSGGSAILARLEALDGPD